MPDPMMAVPTYSPPAAPCVRTTMPIAISTMAPNSVRSSPWRRARPAANSDTTANASKGKVISMPAAVDVRPSCSRIMPISGGTPVMGARNAMAMQRMPRMSHTGRLPERRDEGSRFMPQAYAGAPLPNFETMTNYPGIQPTKSGAPLFPRACIRSRPRPSTLTPPRSLPSRCRWTGRTATTNPPSIATTWASLCWRCAAASPARCRKGYGWCRRNAAYGFRAACHTAIALPPTASSTFCSSRPPPRACPTNAARWRSRPWCAN
ncbi:hypothetical protein D3C72_1125750 [compost metagenome]